MAFRQDRPLSFQEALQVAKQILSRNTQLVERGVIQAEAELLVLAAYRFAEGKQLSRMDLFTRICDRFPESAADQLLIFCGSRSEGRLLQHLIGVQPFLDHEYSVGPGVLIPRPETEVLASSAISTLISQPFEARLGLEVGTGSGILSIELLSRFPHLRMIATELSAKAREYAIQNANLILGKGDQGINRFQIISPNNHLEVLEPFGDFQEKILADFLITNPPYLHLQTEVDSEVFKYEPHEALFAPANDPLHFYRFIADQVQDYIKVGGFVFAEVPHERAENILELFSLPKWDAKIILDLNQRKRVLVAELKVDHG